MERGGECLFNWWWEGEKQRKERMRGREVEKGIDELRENDEDGEGGNNVRKNYRYCMWTGKDRWGE